METKILEEKFKKIKSLLENSKNTAVFTHEDPDGDALGSISAVALALQRLQVKAKFFLSGSLPLNFNFLPFPYFEEELPQDLELVLILDCGNLERTGFEKEILGSKNAVLVNIDHHPQDDPFGNINIVSPSSSSTAELIFYFLRNLNLDIDRDLAECLLTGIFTDTGSFMHSNTTGRVLEIAANLVSKGANIKKIAYNTYRKKDISTLKLWGRVLSRIKTDRTKGIVASVITKKDLEECGATKEDLAGVVNLINSIPEARAALLLREEEGEIQGSLRSESGGLDVRKIANLLGGGGHVRASGFRIKGKLKETEEGWEIVEE